MPYDPDARKKSKDKKLADLDAIEAALKAGAPVEEHLQHYKRLREYIAGFRQRNQDLIDENAVLRNILNAKQQLHGGPAIMAFKVGGVT